MPITIKTNSTPGVPAPTAQPHSSCRQNMSSHKEHWQEDLWIKRVHNLIPNLESRLKLQRNSIYKE